MAEIETTSAIDIVRGKFKQAMDEEQRDDSCFTADVPECQFVRGH